MGYDRNEEIGVSYAVKISSKQLLGDTELEAMETCSSKSVRIRGMMHMGIWGAERGLSHFED